MSNVSSLPLVYGKSVAQDLYAWALTAAYRTGWRLYDPDYALWNEPDAYEKVRRDPVIASAIEQRLHAIAGRTWRCDPARAENELDKKAAQIMEDLIDNITNMNEGMYESAQAVITCRSYLYVSGERQLQAFGDGGVQRWWVPYKLQDMDRRRVRFVPDWDRRADGTRFLKDNKFEVFNIERERWQYLEPENKRAIIKHTYMDEEARLGYGRGLLEAIYFYWYAKEIVLKEGLQGLERWAQGMVVGKIDGLRDANDKTPNEEVARAWLDVIDRMRAENAVVSDKEDEIEVINMSGTGHQMIRSFLEYFDTAITRLIAGSVLPGGGGSSREGSYARAEIESDTAEAIVQYDRDLMADAWTRDLVTLVWLLNRPNFIRSGLAAARMPKFVVVHEKMQDPQVAAGVATTLMSAGIPLLKEEVYQKTGFTMPAIGDEVFVPGAGGEPTPPKG